MTRPALTEAGWMRQVTDLADLLGWRWVHFRPARTDKGWRTPVQGPMGAGWPDLVLVRDRVVIAELKTDTGRVRPEQQETLRALLQAGAEAWIWRPRDWEHVRAVLTRRGRLEEAA